MRLRPRVGEHVDALVGELEVAHRGVVEAFDAGTPFFTALDNWVNLNLVETRTSPDCVLLIRYETRR